MGGPPEVTEIRIGDVDYVVRVEPSGVMSSPLPLVSFVALMVTSLRRLARRDRTWTISVRERSDDPFGAPVHEEVLATRRAAAQRLPDLLSEARTGRAPWRSA